jgi:hypothetical protein
LAARRNAKCLVDRPLVLRGHANSAVALEFRSVTSPTQRLITKFLARTVKAMSVAVETESSSDKGVIGIVSVSVTSGPRTSFKVNQRRMGWIPLSNLDGPV